MSAMLVLIILYTCIHTNAQPWLPIDGVEDGEFSVSAHSFKEAYVPLPLDMKNGCGITFYVAVADQTRPTVKDISLTTNEDDDETDEVVSYIDITIKHPNLHGGQQSVTLSIDSYNELKETSMCFVTCDNMGENSLNLQVGTNSTKTKRVKIIAEKRLACQNIKESSFNLPHYHSTYVIIAALVIINAFLIALIVSQKAGTMKKRLFYYFRNPLNFGESTGLKNEISISDYDQIPSDDVDKPIINIQSETITKKTTDLVHQALPEREDLTKPESSPLIKTNITDLHNNIKKGNDEKEPNIANYLQHETQDEVNNTRRIKVNADKIQQPQDVTVDEDWGEVNDTISDKIQQPQDGSPSSAKSMSWDNLTLSPDCQLNQTFSPMASGDVNEEEVLKQEDEFKPQKDVNILLLGQTGVGKSTFINGLANYSKYPTLEEAEANDLLCPVASQFTITDDVTYEAKKIVIGVDDIYVDDIY